MSDGIPAGNLETTELSDAELRAVAYFAVGVASEGSIGGCDVSNRLSFAGSIINGVMVPEGNSGISIGTLQIDLGQRPVVASTLVAAYQEWATQERPESVLTDVQREQAVRDMGRTGRTIRAEGGRQMDAGIKSHLDRFLASEAGISFVHGNDVTQVDRLMTKIFDPLRKTVLYRGSTPDDQVRITAMVAKIYNQNERLGGRLLSNIQEGHHGSVEDVKEGIGELLGGTADYVQTGRDAALKGAQAFISLRSADQRNLLHQAWQGVLANPLVNPTLTDQDPDRPNLSSEYSAIKTLFLRKENAPALVEALNRGGAYGYDITTARGRSRPQSTSLYAAGDDFVVMDGNGIGKAYIGGAWSDVDRAGLRRTSNRDGTVDLDINRNGTFERLLHVDPTAPVLRPARQATGQAQPARTGAFHLRGDARTRDEHEGAEREPWGSDPLSAKTLNDPFLDSLRAALTSGDDERLGPVVSEFSRSAEGQRMAQMADRLLAEQQALDQPAQEQQAQARPAPLMGM